MSTSFRYGMAMSMQRNIQCINFDVDLPMKICTHTIKRHPSAFVIICRSRPLEEVFVSSNGKARFGFNIDQPTLAHIVKEKSLYKLNKFGGNQGRATYLKCDVRNGIYSEDIFHRREAFGTNTYNNRAAKHFSHFVREAFEGPAVNILLVFVTMALAFDIKGNGLKEGLYDGGSILITAFLVISISVINNFWHNRKLGKYSALKNNIQAEVVRNGRRQHIPIAEIAAGDVVFLKIGDEIPADGLFLDGHSLCVDESSLTGKTVPVEIKHSQNPFLLSGTKVVDGCAKMLVTSVGINTWDEMLGSSNCGSGESKRSQVQPNKLTSAIVEVGLGITLLAFVVGLLHATDCAPEKRQQKRKEFAVFMTHYSSIASPISTNVFAMGEFVAKLFKVDQETFTSNSPLCAPPPKPLLIGTPSESGVFPVLLLIHGYLLYNSFYSQLVQHISSHGFIVIAPQLYSIAGPDTTEEIKSIASITNWLTEGLQHFLPTNIQANLRKLALAGHSRGGKVAFAVALGKAVTSLKFSALIGIDPVDGSEKGKQIPPILSYIPRSFNLDMAVSVIGSGLGELKRNSFFPPSAPKGVNHENFYNECRKPACYFVAKDYGHLDMLDDDTTGIRGKATYYLSTSGESRNPMRRFVGGIVVAFLRTYLEGNSRDLEDIRDGKITAPVELQKVDFLV